MSNNMNANRPAQPYAGAGYYGLTKREQAAITILAALAQGTPQGRLPSVDDAVWLADRLFDKLEAPKVVAQDVPALLKPQAE